MKAIEQYFHVFITLYKMVLTFKSVDWENSSADEILVYYWAILSRVILAWALIVILWMNSLNMNDT